MKRYFKVLKVDALTQFLGLELEYVQDSIINNHVILKQPENRGFLTIRLDYLEEVPDEKAGVLSEDR